MGTLAREVNVQTTVFTQTSLQGRKPEEPILIFNAQSSDEALPSQPYSVVYFQREENEKEPVKKPAPFSGPPLTCPFSLSPMRGIFFFVYKEG
jgi:hypothetical protein